MGLLQRSLLRLAAGPWTVRPGAWGTATSAAAGALQQYACSSSSASVPGGAASGSSSPPAMGTAQPSTSSSEPAEGAGMQRDSPTTFQAAAAMRSRAATHAFLRWSPHERTDSTVAQGRTKSLTNLYHLGQQLRRRLHETHDLATLQQLLDRAHQWGEPLHRGHYGTPVVLVTALHACRRIASTAMQPERVPKSWLRGAAAAASAAEDGRAHVPGTAAAAAVQAGVAAADASAVDGGAPGPEAQQQQQQQQQRRRRQQKAGRQQRFDVAHLQRIMLGLADDLEHMSAHITTLPNLLDFVQVWHSTPGAPRFPSSLADVLEYRLVVGGAPSSAEAAEDVQHMRQTGQLLSSLRYARDQRQKDKEARYAAAARYNHQHLTAAVKQGLRQAGRGGGVPLEALVHAPAGAPLLGLPPTEGMKWAFAACQLMWHPAQHAEAWGLFTAASIKAFDMIAASAAEQKRLLALRRQPEQQPGHEERDGLMADSTTTASTTTTSSSSSSSSVGAAEVLAEAPSAGAARNNDGAADTSSSSSSRRPASSKLPRVESRGAGGALEAPNLSSPVWPLWHLGLTQADLAFCVYAFGSVFYHPTPWVEALARLAGELKDNCTPFVLVPILAALLHGRCEDEPLLRSLGDVLVADPRDVGKCSGTTLVALTAALSIRGLGHPPLVELLLRQLLDRDLVDFNPSVTGAVFKSLPFLLSQNQPLASELARKWSTQLAQLLTSRHNRSSSSSSSNRSRGRSTGLEGSGGQQSAWDPEGEFLADVLKPITDGATGSTSSSSRGGDSRTGPPSGLNTNAAHRLQLWDGLTTDTLLQLLESLAHNRLIDTPGLVEAAAEELLQRLPSMNLDQQARTLQVSVKMRIRHAALLGAAAEHLSRQLQHLLGRKQAMQTAASSGSSSSSTYSGLPGHGSTSGVPGGAAGAEQDRSGGWQWEGQQCNPQQQQDAEERIWEELLPQRRLSLLVAALRHLRMAGYPHNPLYQLAAEVLVTSGSLARLAPIEVAHLATTYGAMGNHSPLMSEHLAARIEQMMPTMSSAELISSLQSLQFMRACPPHLVVNAWSTQLRPWVDQQVGLSASQTLAPSVHALRTLVLLLRTRTFDLCEGADQLVNLARSLVKKGTNSTLMALAMAIGHNHRRDLAQLLTQIAQELVGRGTYVSAGPLLQVLHQCNNIGVVVPELAEALVKRTMHTSDFDQSMEDPGAGDSSSSDETQQEQEQQLQHRRSNAFHRQLLVLLGPYAPELTGQYVEWACSVLQRTAHQLQPWELSRWCSALAGYSQLLEQRLSEEQRQKLAEAVTAAVQHAAAALTQQQQTGAKPPWQQLLGTPPSGALPLVVTGEAVPDVASAFAAAMAQGTASDGGIGSSSSSQESAGGGMHTAQQPQLQLAVQLATNARNLMVALGQQ